MLRNAKKIKIKKINKKKTEKKMQWGKKKKKKHREPVGDRLSDLKKR